MRFLPVLGYEGIYEVSDLGEVRSLDRDVIDKNGVTYPRKGKNLLLAPHKDLQYLQVSLWKNGKGAHYYVHRLVAIAFLPNPSGLPEVNHIDGNRQNNCVTNLEWISRSGNAYHAIATGLKVYSNRLTSQEFYSCLLSVIDGESYLSLSRRVPYKVPYLSVKLRRIAKEMNLEHLLDASLLQQARMRAKANGTENN